MKKYYNMTSFWKNLRTKTKKAFDKIYNGDFILCASSSILFFYTLIMSIFSTINYDEAFTYIKYANPIKPHFFNMDYANNHPLNTFFIYLFTYFYPYNEFAIKLPNLIFLIIYLILSVKIAKSFSRYKLLVFGLLTLYWVLIPQYFSQARGYGISAALVLLFLYDFNNENNDDKKIIRNFYILLFASYAYPGLLPVVAAVAIYYFLLNYKKVFVILKKHYFHIIFLLFNYIFIAYFLISTTTTGKPLYGSKASYITAVTGSYIKTFSKSKIADNIYLLYVISILFLLFGLVTIYYRRTKAKIIFITLLSFLFYFIASNVSGRPYITGRLLLPLYPMVILSIAEILDFLTSGIKNKLFYKLIDGILFILIFYNYIITSDLRIKNANTPDYKALVYKGLNPEIKPPKGLKYHATIDFYQQKLRVVPPFDEINKQPKKLFKVPGKIEIIYLKNKHLLYLIADPELNIKERFFLHIAPVDKQKLQKGREKYGFDNYDFNWSPDSDRYMYIKLPHYKIHYIQIGQKQWSKKFIIN